MNTPTQQVFRIIFLFKPFSHRRLLSVSRHSTVIGSHRLVVFVFFALNDTKIQICSHRLFSKCFQNCKMCVVVVVLEITKQHQIALKVLYLQIDCNRERRDCPQVSKPRPIVQIQEVISKTFNCNWSR